jgi:hypothetical protein
LVCECAEEPKRKRQRTAALHDASRGFETLDGAVYRAMFGIAAAASARPPYLKVCRPRVWNQDKAAGTECQPYLKRMTAGTECQLYLEIWESGQSGRKNGVKLF